jgi:hypothetical protein
MELTCLLEIIEVPFDNRVRCMANGCGHSVYKRVHIIRHNGALLIYGSDCFARKFSGQTVKTGRPQLTTSAGRILSSEERQLLINNTEQLIQQFEAERIAANESEERAAALELERAAAKRAALIERAGAVEFQPKTKWVPPARLANSAKRSLPKYSAAERASVEPEARQLLNARFPSIDFDKPGFNGLLQGEIDRILGERKA